MFERYTEHGRRVIFFARYEASTFGSPWIETEHLLLGALREQRIAAQLGFGAAEAIRRQLEAQVAHPIERIPTSVDLPLSHASKRVLAYSAEEAERLHHKFIDSGHLVLGMMREESCAAAMFLKQLGIELKSYRALVGGDQSSIGSIEPLSNWQGSEPNRAAAASLNPALIALEKLLRGTANHISAYSDLYANDRLKRKDWSRKEALGHLIDWGLAHQQWIAQALTESRVTAPAYPGEKWVSAQQYREARWQDLVDLWVSLNRLLVHVISQIPEEKVNTLCRIGVKDPIPLSQLIVRYVEYCGDLVGQILAHL